MATPRGRTYPPVIDQLLTEPWKFEFFQAVRLIELCAAERILDGSSRHLFVVGHDDPPSAEMIRFRALVSHSFPTGEIAALTLLAPEVDDGSSEFRLEMVVPFFGLFGPSGVLPHHYTQMLLDRSRIRDFALRDFLDVFNHRLISFFYRAATKYRFYIQFERKSWQVRAHELRGPVHDEDRRALFDDCLYALIGHGTPGLLNRLELHNETLIYYAGLLAHYPRNANSLQRMLADYFQLRVKIVQFQGQWLYLSPDDQTALPTRSQSDGLNCRLGRETIVGERVWSVQDKFRVRLGPLDYATFQEFLPTGTRLKLLAQLVRLYVGPEYDFDVQPVLWGKEVPATQLVSASPQTPRLGWTTWLLSHPKQADCDDAVFSDRGLPREPVLV